MTVTVVEEEEEEEVMAAGEALVVAVVGVATEEVEVVEEVEAEDMDGGSGKFIDKFHHGVMWAAFVSMERGVGLS